MKIKIIGTKYFYSQVYKLARKDRKITDKLQTALFLLSQEFRASSLKVHKLSGQLKNKWAFWLTYKLRVVFKREGDTIILVNIGTHDEVY